MWEGNSSDTDLDLFALAVSHGRKHAVSAVDAPRIFVGRWRDSNGTYRVRRSFKSGALYAERYAGSFKGRYERVADFRFESGLIGKLNKDRLEWMHPYTRQWMPGSEAPAVHLELVQRLVQSIGKPMPEDPWVIDPKI